MFGLAPLNDIGADNHSVHHVGKGAAASLWLCIIKGDKNGKQSNICAIKIISAIKFMDIWCFY